MSASPAGQAAVEAAAPAPANPDDRLHLVDALRGFALLGVFLVNIGDFALYWAVPVEDRSALPLGFAARLAEIVSLVFVRGKFYTIFSLLFGLGFAMLLARAMRRGAGFQALYRQRLTVLLLIGAVHMTLVWHGDILTVYALLGFVLMLFARVTDRGLLLWAAIMFALPVLVRTLVVLSEGALDPGGPVRLASQRVERMLLGDLTDADFLPLLQSNDWMLLLKYNLSGPLFRFSDLLSTVRFPRVLGAFLLGMWAGRRGVFENPEGHRLLLRRVLLWGLSRSGWRRTACWRRCRSRDGPCTRRCVSPRTPCPSASRRWRSPMSRRSCCCGCALSGGAGSSCSRRPGAWLSPTICRSQ